MRRILLLTALLQFACAALFAAGDSTVLAQRPALSKTHIVFTWAGDLWVVPRQGGDARRLTTAPGIETNAIFSPDGKTVVFSASYDGNVDIYSVAVTGGEPKRLTYHPGSEVPLAFTPVARAFYSAPAGRHPRASRRFSPWDSIRARRRP